jgi:triacylglycerol lipase
MNFKKLIVAIAVSSVCLTGAVSVQAKVASETTYPVIFAHGMAGWDSIAGYNYFGEDGYGTFIGDACSWGESNGCNNWISRGQQGNKKAEAFQVTSLHNSEVRGEELYNHTLNFMATTGHSKVNFVGHSQGGMDIRKAASRLKDHFNEIRVGAMISISTPHRGTSYAKRIIDLYARNAEDVFCGALPPARDGTDACLQYIDDIANVLFDVATGAGTSGNNVIAGGLQLIYDDYDANDGMITGAKAFNLNYPSEGVAGYVGSIITAQDDDDLNDLLSTLGAIIGLNADGDGYCIDDCNNNGAAGQGNGTIYDMDDDGLVPINSQQMGNRLRYTPDDWTCRWWGCWNPLDTISPVSNTGYVADLNAPNAIQMTSHEAVMDQDHLDVISLGPDDLDEEEFYAAIFEYIHNVGY